MRFLGGLGLFAPVALAIVLFVVPDAIDTWVHDGSRSLLAALTAALAGVALTTVLIFGYVRFRFGHLIRAAERMARGEMAVEVEVPTGGLEGRLASAINDISGSMTATQEAASIDRLTGVANRQALLGALFTEVERASRYGRPLSVAFVDIDHFKAVNDSYGHSVGDLVLRGVAQTIRANLRGTDTVGRYGGEEFMLLLSETDVDEAADLAEKLRHLIQRLRFDVDGNANLTVTISIGVAGGVGQLLRVENLIRDADAAMYSAKSLGRNQTYIFAEPDDDARVPRAPISPAGRARALELGRAARDAATAALTSVISPLPGYRGQPSALIASIVVAMGHQLDLPEAEIDRLKLAALLHDLGKVAVPTEVLEKPTSLDSSEWRSIVQHPRIGQVILEQATSLRDAVPIILHHHERFSGHGYPYGLRGNDIPIGARIVAVADAYDAMIHDRPYKRAMTHEQAIAELRRHAGTQFDPDLVRLFCDLYASRPPLPDARVVAMMASAMAHGEPVAAPQPLSLRQDPGAPRRRRPKPKAPGELATG
jgi:diguanylate cyclase (GGDEF)-like protein